MNIFFLLAFLLFNICFYVYGDPTTEQCETVMNTAYNVTECKCLQDFPKCLLLLIIGGNCNKENFPSGKFVEKPCADVYDQCSLTKNKCEIGVCGCYMSTANCLFQNKCTPFNNIKLINDGSIKSNRPIRLAEGFIAFNDFAGGYF
ncbi:hypothetical protein ACQ4LE_003325 [Meloidogyne hapla]